MEDMKSERKYRHEDHDDEDEAAEHEEIK